APHPSLQGTCCVDQLNSPDVSANLKHYETWGDPSTYPHYAVGWAVAGNTPFRYYKQTTYEGGIRVPLIVAWPNGIRARNETRSQFVHVADIAPTILGATGVKPAEFANDVRQTPLEGQDISPTFASKSRPNQRPGQYFEMYGNKALILDDWAIVTNHRTSTWDMTASREPNEPWELYDLRADPGQTRNVAAQNPERVALLAEQFDAAAPPLLHRSFRMSASLWNIAPNATGPIFASGGRLGGMSLFLRSGVPVLQIRDFAGGSKEVVADARLVGEARIEVDFKRDAAPPMTPIDIGVALRINGNSVGGGVLRAALPATFSLSDSFDIGRDDGSTVAPETATLLTGAISDVTFDFR
ncbi:MAG: sulfatase/phosphatase domain-containing protein, partial [Caulobacterales bacterium]